MYVRRKFVRVRGDLRFKTCLSVLAFLPVLASTGLGQATTRVSVGSDNLQADDDSARPSISATGRHIAFQSAAVNLVPGDSNGVEDVFVHDRTTGTTVRVSVSSTGEQADANSGRPSISDDGRFVAFFSDAGNLATGDSPVFDALTCPNCTGHRDIFVHDRDPDGNGIYDEGNGETIRASVSSGGVPGDGDSTRPSMSGTGRYIAFRSTAGNLVDADSNAVGDVFIRDVDAGTTIRVSVGASGLQGNGKSDRPSISDDGRSVAFYSDADNLVAGDTNMLRDVFVHDLETRVSVRISVGVGGAETDGASSRPAVSADGRHVAFRSDASNLVANDTNGLTDVFVHDRDPDGNGVFDEGIGVIELVSVGLTAPADGSSSTPALSADGRYVAFHSDAGNLVETDQNLARDVFVYDRQTEIVTRISVCGSGTEGGGDSARPTVSGDARFVGFHSAAENLVAGDSNSVDDVFVRDREFIGDDAQCDEASVPTVRQRTCGALGMASILLAVTTLSVLRQRR